MHSVLCATVHATYSWYSFHFKAYQILKLQDGIIVAFSEEMYILKKSFYKVYYTQCFDINNEYFFVQALW